MLSSRGKFFWPPFIVLTSHSGFNCQLQFLCICFILLSCCRGPAALGKINMTQQILCVQIPCILVQDNHNEWPMRIYPATIRSYCFLHSLKSLAETNSAKTAKKKTASNVEATHMAWGTTPEVYCQRRYKTHVMQRIIHMLLSYSTFFSLWICSHITLQKWQRWVSAWKSNVFVQSWK